jgi:glycogen debranching enzyme
VLNVGLEGRLARLRDEAKAGLEALRTDVEVDGASLSLYLAGLRQGDVRFGLFGRDLLISARLLGEAEFTRNVLRFVAATLGSRVDSASGEEPGRGIHEYSPVEMRGLSTRYNAAEVSLLFLIEAERYRRVATDERTLERIGTSLEAAARYLIRHLEDGLFVEDPAFCGADRYALRSTYWKDSQLPGRTDPEYPVSYTLVQAQALAALRAAGRLSDLFDGMEMNVEELRGRAARAVDRLATTLWDAASGRPSIARDRAGPIPGSSSDALHMFAYLEPADLRPDVRDALVKSAANLETPYGYRTYAAGQPDYDPHAYHLGAIWPFEQALIALGAAQHGIEGPVEVALRVVDGLEAVGFAELYYWDEGSGLEDGLSVRGQGCDLQLWSLCVPAALATLSSLHGPSDCG